MKKSQDSKRMRLQANVFLVVFLSYTMIATGYVYAKLYLWKDEQEIFNASQQKPDWWPRAASCIVWVPGKRKVADLVKTKEKTITCELEIRKKRAEKNGVRGNREVFTPRKKLVEPSDREMRIYCTYRKSLLKFIDAHDPEDLAADYVCLRFQVSKDEFATIYSKVLEYKGSEQDCFY
ncbi:MAG: hypothetical protein D3916_03365 [Candidatus Electrothrix sp. MAN1_4]|nr:hypothetical protein [Candidatus Electrothrix sp. MAN1_4]